MVTWVQTVSFMSKYEVVPRHTKEEIATLLMGQKQHLMVKVRDGVYRSLKPDDKVVIKEWQEDGAFPDETTFILTVQDGETNLIHAHQGLSGLYLYVYPAPKIEGCLDDNGDPIEWESDPPAIVEGEWIYNQETVDYYNSLEEEYQNSLKK